MAVIASAIPPARRSSNAVDAGHQFRESPTRMSAHTGVITPVRWDVIGHGDVLTWPALRRTSKADTIPRQLQSENARSETAAPLPLGGAQRSILGLPGASESGGRAARTRNGACFAVHSDEEGYGPRTPRHDRLDHRFRGLWGYFTITPSIRPRPLFYEAETSINTSRLPAGNPTHGHFGGWANSRSCGLPTWPEMKLS
jgi:hypothetical protein